MNQKNQLSIKEFSRLTGIKRENLRFYDKIGLLSPESRGKNNYRYYSRHQLNSAYLIGDLRGLGVGIEDIKRYSMNPTPEKTIELFEQQEERIQNDMKLLQEKSIIMKLHSNMVKDAMAHEESVPYLEEKEEEEIFLCPTLSEDMDEDEGGIFSYEYAEREGINLGFPQGTKIAEKNLLAAENLPIERYYFKVQKGSNACKPKGMYAVIYGRCDTFNPKELYLPLLDYIKEKRYIICGDAYEEYPLGDIAVQKMHRYLFRVEIPVKKQVT